MGWKIGSDPPKNEGGPRRRVLAVAQVAIVSRLPVPGVDSGVPFMRTQGVLCPGPRILAVNDAMYLWFPLSLPLLVVQDGH